MHKRLVVVGLLARQARLARAARREHKVRPDRLAPQAHLVQPAVLARWRS